jgi:predicted dehydrogenase
MSYEELMTRRKVVFAGCGGITGAWMNAIQGFDDVEIVGLCDLSAASIDAFKERWKVEPVSSGDDLDRVIRDSGADTVFDCTIPAAHPTVTQTALGLGCDVLGEKPMAPSLDEALSMVAAARTAGKTYAVIQNRRYLASIRRFRQAIVDAAIGPLTTLDVDFYIGAHFGGFRAEMDHVLLLDMAIHTFDQARFISGADAEYVFASDWNPSGSWYSHGANAVAFFEMSGGVRCTYRGSWCAEGLNTSWEGQWRATCETGTVLWNGASEVTGQREAGGENLIHDFAPVDVAGEVALDHTGHAGVIREFLDSLHAGRKPMTDCTDNVKSIAMVLAAVESAETGKRVKVWKES